MPLRPATEQYVEDIKAVLLVGGLGTRLRSIVPSTPKPLAAVGNRSFLELLVRQLRYQGIRSLVMCSGHLGDQIENEFGNGQAWDVVIEYSREPHPLGTGGAVKLAESYLREASDFLVMNGDSFLEIDFRHLVRFHRRHAGVVSMAVLRVENAARYGTVRVDAENRVTGFSEKMGDEACGLVNAGVYIFDRSVLDHIPEGPTSLEREIFPRLLDLGVYALEQRGRMFIDIGTPEDYARAQELRDSLYETAFRKQECKVPEAG
jgi:D-glycero-alpha-D-manno-heptose 1-phosphate guanylyltransferase